MKIAVSKTPQTSSNLMLEFLTPLICRLDQQLRLRAAIVAAKVPKVPLLLPLALGQPAIHLTPETEKKPAHNSAQQKQTCICLKTFVKQT